ncbi:hypothetical protein [Nocardia sp. XZ_19_369]|uniref:hypothetical protein n=1 Tax=Nocardia sp. XZ_19_369 TaxID=2769487 RepID=UPI00188E1E15|nr:hypothetical protein [Nocardia sp. XZ_19_369]
MERKSPDTRGDKRGGPFAVGTALLAVASVGYVVLAAPGTEAVKGAASIVPQDKPANGRVFVTRC